MKRKVVVTGASSAIGSAICRRIVRPGDEAVLHYFRHEEECRKVAAELGGDVLAVRADLTLDAEIDELCRAAAGADLLVHAAAVTRTGLAAHVPDEDLAAMLQVNIAALVRICRAVIPGMVVKRSGCIVAISSVAARRGNRGQAVYAGTKGFAEAFTRSLAAEYGAKGIRVNCVAPGAIDAGSLKELLVSAEDELRQSNALGRLGTAADVASAVAFLCADEAAFISGRTLVVDGGFCRGV
jgi:3-oxoacyl-[acyl-carrier protein] reductase